MKFIWVVLLAIFMVFGQKAAVPVRAPATPVAAPFDTAGFKLRQEVESLQKEIQTIYESNKATQAAVDRSSAHVDNMILAVLGLFLFLGVLTAIGAIFQSKALNKDVKHDLKEAVDGAKKSVKDAVDDLQAKQAAYQTNQAKLIDQLNADSTQRIQNSEDRLQAVLSGQITKVMKEVGDELRETVGSGSREIRDMKLAHQLFRMNVLLKLEKPKEFCDALNSYYIDAIGLGDHGEIAKAYEDVVELILIFLMVYTKKGPSVKQEHLTSLRTIIVAIGDHLPSDVTKPLANLGKLKPLKVIDFGKKENPWERWVHDDLDIVQPEE